MRKVLLLSIVVLALLVPGVSKAQVDQLPNYGFESWSTHPYPDQWDTASAISKKGIVFNGAMNGGTVQRQSQISYSENGGSQINVYPHQGSYFVELATVAGQSTGVHTGYIQCKYPYTSRPAYFYAEFGFFAQAANEAPVFAITFTKWNTTTNKRDTVLNLAVEVPNQGVVPPWTQGYVPLASYYNPNLTENPDTALVQFQSSGGVVSGSTINYANGTSLIIDNCSFTASQLGGIEMSQFAKIKGAVAYPNPFNGKTTIHYVLNESSQINLSVYDVQGRKVADLVDERQIQGPHDVDFDGSSLKSGVYIYRLQSGDDVETGKLILSR